MALLYLVRHGEADYSQMEGPGFWGFGRAFAPLSAAGVLQARRAAQDARLAEAELIVASPYTRAMQTAALIAQKTGLRLEVEPDLHEWVPDKTNRNRTAEDADRLCAEFARCRGVYPPGEELRWETLAEMRRRMRRAADKYERCEKVIFVGHGMVFRALAPVGKMAPGEVAQWEYRAGQPDCDCLFV